MKKITHKFTIGILLFLISMCIWKVCSHTGQANILCMITVSLLDIIGLIIIISNLYQLEDWNFGEWWLHRCNRLIAFGLSMWIVVLCIQIGVVASFSFEYVSLDNVSMVSYLALQVCYLMNEILTIAIPILYTAILVKTSAKTDAIRIDQYIQLQKWFCSSYAAVVTVCLLISTVLLNTGEHQSTPVFNILLNILYFGVLIYLFLSLYRYSKETQALLSLAVSDIEIKNRKVWKPCCSKQVWGSALLCAMIFGYGAIAYYSTAMDFQYEESYHGDGIILKEYTGLRPYVEIPGEINGQAVIELKSSFYRCKFIKNVSIPKGVNKVGYWTFYGCTNLSSVSLSDGLQVIGEDAFRECINLKEIQIPDSVEEIGDNAFLWCENLERIKLPSNLTVIRTGILGQCNSLKQIVIPESVTEIGKRAFYNCKALQKMEFPEGLEIIQEGVLGNCSNLSNIVMPQSLKWVDRKAFANCINLEIVQMPEAVVYIADDAFEGCQSLGNEIPKTSFMDCEEIIVPEGVTTIWSSMFRDCKKLKYIHLPESLNWIGDSAFAGCISLEEIVIPKQVRELESNVFFMCRELETIEMTGVRRFKANSFEGCANLKYVVISESADFTVQDILDKVKISAATLEELERLSEAQLSTYLFSGQISIGGKVWQFPMHYQGLAMYGITVDADIERIFAPGNFQFIEVGDEDNKYKVKIENTDEVAQLMRECHVTAVELYPHKIADLEVCLPGGLKIQDCSKEMIIAKYGEPQEIIEDSLASDTFTYVDYNNTTVRFRFSKEDESLFEVFLYKPVPSKVKSSPGLFAEPLKINGETYRFPMTNEAFTTLGWEEDTSVDEAADEQSYYSRYFNMGENKCEVSIENLTNEGTSEESYKITGIQISFSNCKDLDVRLAGGFELMKCSKEEFEDTYGSPNDGFGQSKYNDWILYRDDAAGMEAAFYFNKDTKNLRTFWFGTALY